MALTENTESTERKKKMISYNEYKAYLKGRWLADVTGIFFAPRKKIPVNSPSLSVSSVRKNPGFTLLELLVVISIIAILAGMVMPTFYYAKKRAREAKARVAVKQLETAFKAYLDTYKVWPADAVGFVNGDIKDDIFKVMRGEDISSMNPQGIAFFEFESTTNYPAAYEFYALDPWSDPTPGEESTLKAYQVMFDKDYDNKITLPAALGGDEVYRCVVVWSKGEDRGNGGEDDVASWK